MNQLHLHHLFQINEVEIVYRNQVPYQNRIQITSSHLAYEILLATWKQNKLDLIEQFRILLLNRRNACLSVSTAACLADPKVIFVTALKANASDIILAHNHPSGNLQPSDFNRQLTRKLKDGGKLLDIAVLDHLIITPRDYKSFADERLMP